ncbi:FMN dependent dehydrogenase [Aspergillus ustus]|uniref:FMN dependent dehydrogenase n=1 Tax=Aspergillus ustus TaxID=40382 RepID=A0A0C1E5D0_ASPUT|nr:FMN dependent dehydrogenase [Aspergillus ustus]
MSETRGDYQKVIYTDGVHGLRPLVTTDPGRLEAQARRILDKRSFDYIAGGAGGKVTMARNRLAFNQWMLLQSTVDISTTLFGQTYPSPILMAPIGVQSLAHPDKEPGLAEVCSAVDVPYIMSSAANSSFEDVAAARGSGKTWYQLYWPKDNDITVSLLDRARQNGFEALAVTLDTWSLAWRPADLDNGFLPFLAGNGTEFGLSDPVFQAKFKAKTGTSVHEDIVGASREWMNQIVGQNHTWEEIAFLRNAWKGPLVLKGIQCVQDAQTALSYGCDGIVVSNHGGRQLDGAVGSLDVLPEIVDAVGTRMTVLFDSGIRTGSDIVKALALGAHAVLVGRPVMYGYAINGKPGAKAVLQGLLADLYLSMATAGISSISACNRGVLRKVSGARDVKL